MPYKAEKWDALSQEQNFLKHHFLDFYQCAISLNVLYYGDLCYLLCSCTNPKSLQINIWKNLKSAVSREQINETASLFVCSYKFTKMKSWFKMMVWHDQNCLWPVWSWDCEIDCIGIMSRLNKLIFCMLIQIHINQKLINFF